MTNAQGEPGFTLERLADGETTYSSTPSGSWAPLMTGEGPFDEVSCRGTFKPKQSGSHYMGCSGLGPTQLFINDELVFEQKENNKDFMGFLLGGGDQENFRYRFEAGREYAVHVKTVRPENGDSGLSLLDGVVGLNLSFMLDSEHDEDVLSEAVDLARTADVVIVCTGHTPDWETEGQDQVSFNLPARGSQDALVHAVAAVNKNVIVVNSTGVAVAMPWLDEVPALLQGWFPGQEAGNAIADVLLGKVNPGGRLPVSFPRRLEDAPAHGNFPGAVVDGRPEVEYAEGVFVGYRHYDRHDASKLNFPFGFGLSYTSYGIGDLRLERRGRTLGVKVAVTNTGAVPGAHVVQIYAGPAFKSEVDMPVKQLVGFAKVAVAPGETKTAEVEVSLDKLAYFAEGEGKWVVQKGRWVVYAGSNAADVDVKEEIEIAERWSFDP